MELSRAQRASHLDEWRESGETATRYCEEHGLKLGSFRYWSGRIRREGPTTGDVSEELAGDVRFAAVRRRSPSRAGDPRSSGVRVRVGDAEVELSPGFDEETLARALGVLSSMEGGR